MKTLEVQVPDQIAREVDEAVLSGSFADKTEVVLAALRDFVKHGRFKLIEDQQLRDIAWAKSQKPD
jgi:Arc/MetJ-type ribon-helix-helix transcriptional regulator